jgi:hypothetical protein
LCVRSYAICCILALLLIDTYALAWACKQKTYNCIINIVISCGVFNGSNVRRCSDNSTSLVVQVTVVILVVVMVVLVGPDITVLQKSERTE